MVCAPKSYIVNEGPKVLILILWLFVNVGLFYFTFVHYYYGPQFYYLHQMLGYGLCLSRASAACINLNACLILLPMCRSVLTLMRSMSRVSRQCRRLLDRSKSFHISCAYMLCFMTALHCGAHSFNAINFCAHFNTEFLDINVASFPNQNPFIVVITSVPGVTGILMVTCLSTIAITASGPLRRKGYRRFWRAHHLFIAFYALLLIHACSGILKYQSNVTEHVPGCYVKKTNGMMKNDSIKAMVIIPEPEFYPHSEKSMGYAEPMPEPERGHIQHQPMPEPERGHTQHRPMPEGEPWPHLRTCDQPAPEFKSCSTEAWIWLSAPLLLYLLERLSRYIGSSSRQAEIVDVVEHPNDVIEIELYQKDFKPKPGQSVWLRCPEISNVECHPFTLTSLPSISKPNFTIHVMVTGEWTKGLREILTSKNRLALRAMPRQYGRSVCIERSSQPECPAEYCGQAPKTKNRSVTENRRTDEFVAVGIDRDSTPGERTKSKFSKLRQHDSLNSLDENTNINLSFSNHESDVKLPRFFIHGPHGSAMEDIFKYKVSLCVAGGIGITPFASVLNMILRESNSSDQFKLRRMYLVWICRTIRSFEWFLDLINSVHQHLWDANMPDFFNVYLHVTRCDSDTERQELSSSSHPGLEKCRLERGRPDIKAFIRNLSTRHSNTSVGVFCCGPRSLNSSVREECFSSKAGRNVTFVFNKESF